MHRAPGHRGPCGTFSGSRGRVFRLESHLHRERHDEFATALASRSLALALAIGDRGSVDGDIDHGRAHLRTNRKSRQRAWLPLPLQAPSFIVRSSFSNR